MIRLLDDVLDRITMYRLVLYYLIALVGSAVLMTLAGLMPQNAADLLFSAVLILATCYVANWVFARVFRVPANAESGHITALILALIMDPASPADPHSVGVIVFVSIWAMAGKYMLALGGKHVFNPAALAVLLTGWWLATPASWWIAGNLQLLPVVLAGGVLVVRKLRRTDLILAFFAAALATLLVTTTPANWPAVVLETMRSSPLFFFAFVMLTEPLTAPTMRWSRLTFAALVGVLFAPTVHFGSFYLTPELALIIGNLFALLTGPRGRHQLTLERIEQAATDTYDFVFSSHKPLRFAAGQYLEWTLDTDHPDNRGNRRYFTLANAPTENRVRLGIKFYPESSAFKRSLAAMQPGESIYAGQLAGGFTLPRSRKRKLVFIAGGIGITPFRSMLRELLDRDERREIVVLYGNERQADIAYLDVLAEAQSRLGVTTHHAIARDAAIGDWAGYITAEMVQETVPDWRERLFYISGPQAMVAAIKKMLLDLGVPRKNIIVDFFPGFA